MYVRVSYTRVVRGTMHVFSVFFHTPFQLLDKPWSQVRCRCRAFSPVLGFNFFFPHRVQQSHSLLVDCSSSVADSRSRAFSASQSKHKKKPPRSYTSTHSRGFELTKLTYTRLEDNLIRHRGDRPMYIWARGVKYRGALCFTFHVLDMA